MSVRQDLRVAVRLLARDRGFTALAVLALGLGIGVNTMFFSLVNAAVLRGLPVHESEGVMFLSLRDAKNVPRAFSYAEYEELGRGLRTFASVGGYASAPATLTDVDLPPERVLATSLSASGFRALGVAPLLGRGAGADDDRVGAPPVIVLSELMWRTRYGAQPSVLGRVVMLNGEAVTIIGVMPESFRFPGNADLWRPLASVPALAASSRDARGVSVFARLSPETGRAQAQAEFESLYTSWARTYPSLYEGVRPSVVPLNQQFYGRVTDTVWIAFITAGGLVLLIACANVANLLLMRAAARAQEIATRVSLGATRLRIVRQLLLESTALAALGAAAGLICSMAGLRLLQSIVPAEVATLFDFTLDRRVLAALVGATALSVLVFGAAPALHLAGGSTAHALRTHDGATITRRRWATAFLAAEFALTLVLVANVAMSIRTARAALDAEFPIDPTPVLTTSLTLPNQPYGTPEARTRFIRQVEDTIAALPSVESFAAASTLPGGGGPQRRVSIADRRAAGTASAPTAVTVFVGDAYFQTIGTPLVSGRLFTAADGAPGQDTAIVNERFATVFLAGEEPVGQLIRISESEQADGPWRRIVGVAPSIRQSGGGGIEPDPVVYLPLRSAPPPTVALMVRAAGDPAALIPSVREAVRQLDSALPLYRTMTLDEAMRQQQWNGRISRVLLTGIGIVALLLASVGLYAVTAHAVRLRRREIGIRLALGARRRDVGTVVLGRAIRQMAIGLVAGIGATIAFDRLFIPATTGVQLTDAVVLLPALLGILAVGAAACLWPAFRAASLDPAAVLHHE